MTLRPGWPAYPSGGATFQDIRLDAAGDIARNAAGAIRAGVLPAHTNALVTAKATMAVDIGVAAFAIDRTGLVRVYNDGTITVTISAAPGAGSRWSVIYVKQRESAAPFSDGADGPVADKVESTTSEAAARALLPAGALELAVVQTPAGATGTTGSVITQTYLYTASAGGTVLLRNQTEQDAWTPGNGALATRIDTGMLLIRTAGAWVNATQTATTLVTTFGASVTAGSAAPPMVWAVGDTVFISGTVTVAVGYNENFILEVPVGFRLTGARTDTMIGTGLTNAGKVFQLYMLKSNHRVQIVWKTASAGASEQLAIHGFWRRDV